MTDPVPINREVIDADLAILKELGATKMLADLLEIKNPDAYSPAEFHELLGHARQLSNRLGEAYSWLAGYLQTNPQPKTTMRLAFAETIEAATEKLDKIFDEVIDLIIHPDYPGNK